MPFIHTASAAGRALRSPLALAVGLLLAAGSVSAADIDRHSRVPAPQDTPYPGTLAVHVDASDTRQGIFRVHETIPASEGELTLLFPQWIPGEHSPSGPVAMMAGLKLSANGQPLQWQRDPFDVTAFHLQVPAGATQVEADFQYLSARDGGYEMTDKMLDLEWNKMALYPAGHYSRQVKIQPSVTLPAGWQYGSALEAVSKDGDTTTFKPVPFDTLVDSPIYAGRYYRRLDLTPAGSAPVYLDVFADAPRYLQTTPEQEQLHRNLATQALKLFGSHHYDHYNFLFSLSDQLGGNGLEHHQSSEDGLEADYFTAWDVNASSRDLLAHEYVHSWNGKFRRPAALWSPNFNVPMGPKLLWLYEGQTQYWGYVLTARAGLWSPQQFRDALAMTAANYERNRVGLQWRTLEDTTADPAAAHRAPLPYRSWQMSEEYYSGGQMMWLAADAKLRELSHGKKSLDDFAQAFFGMDDGSFVTRTYDFDEIASTLDSVVHYDWAKWLTAHARSLNPPLLEGLEGSGWKLVYTDEPSDYERDYNNRRQPARHIYNFAWSIGLTLADDASINDVRWEGPAFKAGISTGETLLAVNGQDYSRERLQQAITEAKDSQEPIRLTFKFQGGIHEVALDYHEGLKYPHLQRVQGTPDYLSQIIAAKR